MNIILCILMVWLALIIARLPQSRNFVVTIGKKVFSFARKTLSCLRPYSGALTVFAVSAFGGFIAAFILVPWLVSISNADIGAETISVLATFIPMLASLIGIKIYGIGNQEKNEKARFIIRTVYPLCVFLGFLFAYVIAPFAMPNDIAFAKGFQQGISATNTLKAVIDALGR